MSRIPQLKATCYDKRGRVIAVGRNSYSKTHPLQAHFAELVHKPDAIYLHAEIAALLKCGDKKPHSIFIERYFQNGQPALAAPCKICKAALKAFGVKQISYTI